MERTREAKFLVKEPSGSTIFSTNNIHLWFEALEGEETIGTRVRIPANPVEYDDSDLFEKIDSLEGGDIVLAVLEREDESDVWRPTSLEEVE